MRSRLRMLRRVGRHQGHDGRPPAQTPVEELHLDCGRGTEGFEAIPGGGWATAETIARGEPGPSSLPRFREGRLIDEGVAAEVAP